MSLTLLDALDNYDALVARIPLHQWRDATGKACAACECEYVQAAGAAAMGALTPARRRRIKPCSHREPGQKSFHLRAVTGPRSDDPMSVVALRADIDRQIDALPGMARDLFHLRYRTLVRDSKTGELRQMTLVEVRQKLRRPWTVVAECHALHFARMERALIDWFPAGRSWRIA